MITVKISLESMRGRRPLSTLVQVKSWEEYQEHKATYKDKAIAKICYDRKMTIRDLVKYGYNTIKAEVYNNEKNTYQ
jgi:hypothetical protein